MLEIQAGQRYLEIACGNGLPSRRLAALGGEVTAFDFSSNLIEKARSRANPGSMIEYRVIDATDEQQLLGLGEGSFAALSKIAVFDMAELEPLFPDPPGFQ